MTVDGALSTAVEHARFPPGVLHGQADQAELPTSPLPHPSRPHGLHPTPHASDGNDERPIRPGPLDRPSLSSHPINPSLRHAKSLRLPRRAAKSPRLPRRAARSPRLRRRAARNPRLPRRAAKSPGLPRRAARTPDRRRRSSSRPSTRLSGASLRIARMRSAQTPFPRSVIARRPALARRMVRAIPGNGRNDPRAERHNRKPTGNDP